MIGNPFLYRAADARSGGMVDERNFINLFGVSALGLLNEKIQHLWALPVLLISAPGGGKSSLMRIFSPSSLRYVRETARIGGNRQALSEKLTALGAFKNGDPYALGVWLRLSDEYRGFDDFEDGSHHGLFCAMLNSRVLLNALNGVCVLYDLAVATDLDRISIKLKEDANPDALKIWSQWGTPSAKDLYKTMADLEATLCDLIDNPFWDGDRSSLSHSGLWSLEVLANLKFFVNDVEVLLRPLVMLDDLHELSERQIVYILNLIVSRQLPVELWVSLRKQALGLSEILTGNLGKGAERGRDYELIDFEDNKGDYRKRVLEISKLRVQSIAAQIGGASQAFVDFLSDEREEIFLQNLDIQVASEIKSRILSDAGHELTRFESLIKDVEKEYSIPHDKCRHLRMLSILVHRELSKRQKSFPFFEISQEAFKKHESNKAIVEAAETFLAEEYKLPYYFGAQRLITLSSFNIDQFLKLAGALFEEIMTAIRLERDQDSFIPPSRQDKILKRVAEDFLRDIPIMVPNGNQVMRLVQAIGDMCKSETYRPTAPYAPGVTGTALTMHEFERLSKSASKGTDDQFELYRAIQSAIAHNILEPESNYKCKGQEYLVLYLNRLICVPFRLPLQRGGFREQRLDTLLGWMTKGYRKPKQNENQVTLWP
jgi:hypothetical protein